MNILRSLREPIWNAACPINSEYLLDVGCPVTFKTVTLHPIRPKSTGSGKLWSVDEKGNSENTVGLINDGIDALVHRLENLPPGRGRLCVVSVFGSLSELEQIIMRLNTVSLPLLIEINVSCPNVQHTGPFTQNHYTRLRDMSLHEIGLKIGAYQSVEFKVDFITAVNTIAGRGGHDLFPVALTKVRELVQQGHTVIAAGGVDCYERARTMFDAGAVGVQVATAYLDLQMRPQIDTAHRIFDPVFRDMMDQVETHVRRNGPVTLACGKTSDMYYNFRDALRHPSLVARLYRYIIEDVRRLGDFDAIAAVPNGGVPYATMVASILRKPLFLIPKEDKPHGVVSEFKADRVLLVEDVRTTGQSAACAATKIEGFIVHYSVLNRSGDNTASLLTPKFLRWAARYPRREQSKDRPTTVFAIDTDEAVKHLWSMSEEAKDELYAIKVHAERIVDLRSALHLAWGPYRRWIIDRKFGDIGHTTMIQLDAIENSLFEIGNEYKETELIYTVSLTPGTTVLNAFGLYDRVLLVARMSSAEHADPIAVQQCADLAMTDSRVVGVVSQDDIGSKDGIIHFVPGLHPKCTADAYGQRYRTKEELAFASVFIMGRGFYDR